MGLDVVSRRRWLGGIALVLALILLVVAETGLSGAYRALALVLCFVLTLVAIVTAFRDARALQTKVHQAQRDLLESTLKDIEEKVKTKRQTAKRNSDNRR